MRRRSVRAVPRDPPALLLLDEPVGHHRAVEGQEDLEEQLERSDVSCLFVSHDRFFTRTAATRFLEIRRGRLLEIDDPDAFFDAKARMASSERATPVALGVMSATGVARSDEHDAQLTGRKIARQADQRLGAGISAVSVSGFTSLSIGDAVAPAPTLEPIPLPLPAGLPPAEPGRMSLPPKPGTRVSGIGEDWARRYRPRRRSHPS